VGGLRVTALLSQKLAKLERRTQKAMVEMMSEAQAEAAA
jgi:hypothetical protein